MPTVPANTPPRLGQRVEDLARTWLAADTFLSQYTTRERDQDGLIASPDAPPNAIILIVARDEGRYHRLLPIRNLRLAFMVRANRESTKAEEFAAIVGALETKLDTANVTQVLSGPLVATMLAARGPGEQIRYDKLVREATVAVELKCVAAELTVQGTGVPG